MATIIQLRRDTAASWTATNPTLASGEYGFELDTQKAKIGDGSTTWTSLPYVTDGGGGAVVWGSISGVLSNQTDLQGALDAKTNQTDFNNHTNDISFKHDASGILFDDSVVGGGFTQVQQALDFFDDQIALRETAATGVTVGGLVTANNPVAVSVAAGSGEIVDGYTDRRNPTRIAFSWAEDLAFNINMPNINGTQVIYVDSSGVIGQQETILNATQRRNLVQLAFVTYRNGTIDSIDTAGIASNEVGNTLYDWIYFTDIDKRFKGFGIEPVTNVLSIWAEGGELFGPGINIANDITDANIKTFLPLGDNATPAVFDVMFADGTVQAAAQTVIPNYSENPPGVIDPLPGNNATIHYMYRTVDNELILQLGHVEYGDAKAARDNLQTDFNSHTPFIGSDIGILTNQIYVEGNAPDFNDLNDAGIVSVLGGSSGGGGGVQVEAFLDLTDVAETSYANKSGDLVLVNDTETGLVFGNTLTLKDTLDLEIGSVGSLASDDGIYFARIADSIYDPNDGGIVAIPGTLEIHGGVTNVQSLAGVDNRQVYVNAKGSLYSVTPPPPGWSVSDTSTHTQQLTGLQVWYSVPDLIVTIPVDVANGETLNIYTNIWIQNFAGNSSGSIGIGYGVNGSPPASVSLTQNISAGFVGLVPLSITTTTQVLTAGDTVNLYVRRESQDNTQFDPWLNGALGTHEITVSTLAGGSGASEFTQLTDTPADYVGQTGKVVSVKADETGLEYTTPTSGGDFKSDGSVPMSGAMVLNFVDPTIHFKPTTLFESSSIEFYNNTGGLIGKVFANVSGFGFADGSGRTATMNSSGNFMVSVLAPQAASDLTRKDYVDGVVGGGSLPASFDFNDIKDNGAYHRTVTSGTMTNKPNNLPDNSRFMLTVGRSELTTTRVVQTIIGQDNGAEYNVWTRVLQDSTWFGWLQAGTRSSPIIGDANVAYLGGNFRVNNTTIGLPVAHYGGLIVTGDSVGGGGIHSQMFISASSGQSWTRGRQSNVWTGWKAAS